MSEIITSGTTTPANTLQASPMKKRAITWALLGSGILSLATLGAQGVGYLRGDKDKAVAGVEAKEITISEAKAKAVGERFKTTFTVAGDYSPHPAILLLNSEANHRSPTNTTVVLKGSSYKKGDLLNRRVTVEGTVGTYTNKKSGVTQQQLVGEKVTPH